MNILKGSRFPATNNQPNMKPIALLRAAAAALLLSACQTMQGLGRDMQRAGGSIENRAAR